MLATYKLDPTKEEYTLCVDSFAYSFKLYQENGHVEDEVFEKLGLPMDKDVIDIVVRYYVGVCVIILCYIVKWLSG